MDPVVVPMALVSEMVDTASLVSGPGAVSMLHDSEDEEDVLGYDAAGDMNEAVPRDSTETVPLPASVPVTDTAYASWIRSVVCRLWGQVRLLQTCPGPNPVCMERSHIPHVASCENEYVVAEKTDGVRYLLCCCASDHVAGEEGGKHLAFMIDRAFDAYEVEIEGLPDVIYKGTLLDGELVAEHDGNLKYLVYDTVACAGSHVGNTEDYVRRLDLLAPLIEQDIPPKNAPPSATSSKPAGPVRVLPCSSVHGGFPILRKPVYSGAFARHIMYMAGIGVPPPPGPELGRFRHASDGVILTPSDMAVVTGTHWSALKLKDQNPIDLLLEATIGNAQEWSEYVNPSATKGTSTMKTLRDTLSADASASPDKNDKESGTSYKTTQVLSDGTKTLQVSRWAMATAPGPAAAAAPKVQEVTRSPMNSAKDTSVSCALAAHDAKVDKLRLKNKLRVNQLQFGVAGAAVPLQSNKSKRKRRRSSDYDDSSSDDGTQQPSEDGQDEGRRGLTKAERRMLARKKRIAEKEKAAAEAKRIAINAARIKARAKARIDKLREQAKVVSDTTKPTDDEILDQPASVQWKIRLLYREGRSFKDAVTGFSYMGYNVKFTLNDSPMLRAVLSGFEPIVREQHLYARRQRLVTNGERQEMNSLRAISVVVECNVKLDLAREELACTVVRARQDKLDPNSRLTITRTLLAVQKPVNFDEVIEALEQNAQQASSRSMSRRNRYAEDGEYCGYT